MTEDLKNVEFETSEEVDVTPTFDNMGLREELLRGIYAYGTHILIMIEHTNRKNNLFCSLVLEVVFISYT